MNTQNLDTVENQSVFNFFKAKELIIYQNATPLRGLECGKFAFRVIFQFDYLVILIKPFQIHRILENDFQNAFYPRPISTNFPD